MLVRAECVRCPWLQSEMKVATILGIFPLVGVTTAIQNHRRGCRRVQKFSMGSKIIKIKVLGKKKKFGPHPPISSSPMISLKQSMTTFQETTLSNCNVVVPFAVLQTTPHIPRVVKISRRSKMTSSTSSRQLLTTWGRTSWP